MYPGMMAWWKHAHRHGAHGRCGSEASAAWCGSESSSGPQEPPWGAAPWAHFGGHGPHDDFGGGQFGVRRPLRFLAHKLDLDEAQVAELARILDDLKTERAQAAVDDRRAVSTFADALSEETWDPSKVGAAADDRVKSAERLRDAVVRAIGRIHAVLTAPQRAKLAYLVRTGVLSF